MPLMLMRSIPMMRYEERFLENKATGLVGKLSENGEFLSILWRHLAFLRVVS
jgi:hypothetical protein